MLKLLTFSAVLCVIKALAAGAARGREEFVFDPFVLFGKTYIRESGGVSKVWSGELWSTMPDLPLMNNVISPTYDLLCFRGSYNIASFYQSVQNG